MDEEINISTAANQPKKVASDGQSVENHSLKEQMAAARFVKSNRVLDEPDTGFGIKLVKMKPGGVV